MHRVFLGTSLVLLFMLRKAAAQSPVPTVRIGAQEWMRDNLNVTEFRNGDGIPTATDSAAWVQAGRRRIPTWRAYGNATANRQRYGLLYNHYAAVDPRGVCPTGFRVPSSEDWDVLEATLSEERAAKRLKTRTGWENNGNGTDDVGFGGLPGGFRTDYGVDFLEGRVGYWWTDDGRSFTTPTAVAVLLFDYSDRNFRIEYPPAIGQSIRCLRK